MAAPRVLVGIANDDLVKFAKNSSHNSQLTEVAELNSFSFTETSVSSNSAFPVCIQNCHIGNINLQVLVLSSFFCNESCPETKSKDKAIRRRIIVESLSEDNQS